MRGMMLPPSSRDSQSQLFESFNRSLSEDGFYSDNSVESGSDGQDHMRESRYSPSPCFDPDRAGRSEPSKQLAVSGARRLLSKSCTLAEKLGDLAFACLSLRSFQLPLEVRERVRSFLPAPEEELAGRHILGLHNGHDFFFRSMASLPAGRLKCSHDYPSYSYQGHGCFSVADFCASLGCPVAPTAPVALARRCSDGFDGKKERLVPLPAEFAVLVPRDAPAQLQALLEYMEHEDNEDWYRDVRVLDPLENCDSPIDADSDYRSQRQRHRADELAARSERWDPQSNRPLELDRQLHSVAGYAQPDHVLGMGPGPIRKYACPDHAPKVLIRNLLHRGANPSITIKGETALEKAMNARESLRSHIQDLRAGRLSPDKVLQKYAHSKTFEEAREHARAFLAELQMFEDSIRLLRAAAKAWSKASPAKQTFCSQLYLHGKGVLRPDPGTLHHALMAAEQESARAPPVLLEDILDLATAMWKLARGRTGRICSQCGMRPIQDFSKSQLNNRKDRRRCKSCTGADQPKRGKKAKVSHGSLALDLSLFRV